MRKIGSGHVALFAVLLTLVVALAIGSGGAVVDAVALGDFRAVCLVALTIFLVYVYAIVVYRTFLVLFPLQEGSIAAGSRAEFAANIHFLFYLILFNSLIRTHFLPAPLLRVVYVALGARMGSNTYSVGAILDPDGRPCLLKLEGIESRPGSALSFDVVADMDRPDEPALLGRLEVRNAEPEHHGVTA